MIDLLSETSERIKYTSTYRHTMENGLRNIYLMLIVQKYVFIKAQKYAVIY